VEGNYPLNGWSTVMISQTMIDSASVMMRLMLFAGPAVPIIRKTWSQLCCDCVQPNRFGGTVAYSERLEALRSDSTSPRSMEAH